MVPDDTVPDRGDAPDGSRGASRRAFLKGAGLTAAGVAVGGVVGGAIGAGIGAQDAGHESGEEFAVLPERSEPGFDHLVVLMFENRSFDNLLGYLYDETNLPAGARFDGLHFGDYSNPDPAGGEIRTHVYDNPSTDVYTGRNTVINDEMHHSCIISTLVRKHGLEHLTARDEFAPTIDNAVTLSRPRQPGTWPDTHPQYIPINPEAAGPAPGDEDRPLSPPGIGLVGLLSARFGPPGEPVPRTYREAYELVNREGAGLFGR